jgi:hypothetical protein
MVKKYLFSFLTAFAIQYAYAQLGISGVYNTFSTPGWDKSFKEITGSSNGVWSGTHAGVNGWMRLKKKRVEFEPGLGYGLSKKGSGSFEIEARQADISFNTLIYPFDINSDCNCPTFSKQGDAFSKGFFVLLGGGASWFDLQIKDDGLSGFSDKALSWFGNFGIGLDVGISKLIAISPFVRFRFYPSINWEGLNSSSDTDMKSLEGGLKINFRFNQ